VSQQIAETVLAGIRSDTRSIEGLFQARSVSYRIEEVAGVVGGIVVVFVSDGQKGLQENLQARLGEIIWGFFQLA
jgi:hypothetical protein